MQNPILENSLHLMLSHHTYDVFPTTNKKSSYPRGGKREIQLHPGSRMKMYIYPGRENRNAFVLGKRKGKCSNILMREKRNAVTFGEGKGKCCFIWVREKGNAVTSGKGKGKCSYIREGKREMQLHLEREIGNLSESVLR